MRLVLYQPDIPQNTGAILRLAACFGVAVDLIEPAGFVWDDRKLRRAGMDYLDQVDLNRIASWEGYSGMIQPGRLVLATTKGSERYETFQFQNDDRLLFGRESAGVPDSVHQAVDARVHIPMRPDQRSLNVAQSAAIVLSEALRQTNGLP